MVHETTAPLQCGNCGARILRPSSSPSCPYCGGEIASRGAAQRGRADPRADAARERFARLRAHPELESWLASRPNAAPLEPRSRTVTLVFLVMWLGVATTMTVLAASFAGPLAIAPALIGVTGVVMLSRALRRRERLVRTSTEARLAIVREKRTQSAEQADGAREERWFATLEDDDGTRAEFETRGETWGVLSPGDAGVAYVAGTTLIGFQRASV